MDRLHPAAAVLGVLHAQRDQALQLDRVGADPAPAQMAAQGAGHRGHHHVVDRAAQLVLDRLEVVQRRPDPGEAPVGADRAVVGAGRGGLDPGPGQGAGGHGAVADPGHHPARGAQQGAGRALDLARSRALDQCLAEQLGRRRGGGGAASCARGRRGGGLGRAVEQHRDQVHAADPVHQRVVGLGQQGEPPALQALRPATAPTAACRGPAAGRTPGRPALAAAPRCRAGAARSRARGTRGSGAGRRPTSAGPAPAAPRPGAGGSGARGAGVARPRRPAPRGWAGRPRTASPRPRACARRRPPGAGRRRRGR